LFAVLLNVAAGQKVIVAPVGSTIYPINGEPFTLKKAKIRGAESEGMICAEDEIGIGVSHDGIKVLPAETIPGTAVADLFRPYQDYIFEIGLTPNRMDAMSHLGVAKDVCAWLSHHHGATVKAKLPYPSDITADEPSTGITVTVENPTACKRYSGISINNITVTDSPKWLQEKLKAIGLKPINNIVDITNYILHETGQPLHAFDADKITGKQVIVKTLSAGTLFKTLDDKERKLTAGDLMICNAAEPMCIAGVYGGINSGVTNHTKNIFLESACFDAGFIRKTSLHHDLRTDAATRFEKGTDISNTIPVLIRAATMMKELAGGKIAGEPIDVFPDPPQKMQVTLPHTYLKKLSGKEYAVDAFRNILVSLGFEITTAEPMLQQWLFHFIKPISAYRPISLKKSCALMD
jgi:phenylalanyl-tRNA synthetase beta chain